MIDTARLASDAFGRWPGILVSLGIGSDFLKNEHGPCPVCGGRDRFRFDDRGNGRWICNQCGAGDGFQLLRNLYGWDFFRAKEEVARVVGTADTQPVRERSREDRLKSAAKVWESARKIKPGDPAARYLQRRCGVEVFPPILRLHPELKHPTSGQYFPALVALMRGPDGKSCGVHRIFLTNAGEKAPVENQKAALGELGSIHLAHAGETLGIAEGVETALCAARLFQVPVWSAVCANGMEAWEPPKGVRRALVFGDNDASFTGQAAAYELARRLRMKGLEVSVHIPPEVGTDWADQPRIEVA